MALPIAEFNAFHALGAVFAAWAVIVAVLGFTRADFPRGDGAMRAVLAISALLMVAAVGSAIITAASEESNAESHNAEGPRPASDNPGRGP